MKKIDRLFACVGAQKSGTTWLYSMLSKHPDLHFGFFKEIHYFDFVHCGTNYLNNRRAERLIELCARKPEVVTRYMNCMDERSGEKGDYLTLDAALTPVTDSW